MTHITEFHSVGITLHEVDLMSSPSFELGCSPAEQVGSPEVRDMSWQTFDSEAELRLWEDGLGPKGSEHPWKNRITVEHGVTDHNGLVESDY